MAADKREELFNRIPAYAIGALDDDERAEFEAWLQDDPETQALLAEYQAVADHLVILAPLRAAPDHLQSDLRQRLAASRGDADKNVAGDGAQGWWRGLFGHRARLVFVAAAVLCVVVVGVLLLWYDGADDGAPPPDAASLYEQLVAQPGSSRYTVIPGDVHDAVGGSLVVSPDGKQAVLRVSKLPAIGSDQAFQMWLIDTSGARTSGGLFAPDPAQETLFIRVPLEQSIDAYQGVGVSLEPAGGSPYADRPTGPRVLSVPLG